MPEGVAMPGRAAILLALALPLAAPSAVVAAGRAPQVEQAWSVLDRCRRQSFEKFPDQTKAGEEQRRRYVKSCQQERSGSTTPLLPPSPSAPPNSVD